MRQRFFRFLLVPLLAGLPAAPLLAAGGTAWSAVAEQVVAEIDRAERLAKAGQGDDAKEAVINAYFGVFEDLKMEIAERQSLGAKHVAVVEEMFNALRKAAGGSADLHAQAEPLRQALRADGKALDAAKVVVEGAQ